MIAAAPVTGLGQYGSCRRSSPVFQSPGVSNWSQLVPGVSAASSRKRTRSSWLEIRSSLPWSGSGSLDSASIPSDRTSLAIATAAARTWCLSGRLGESVSNAMTVSNFAAPGTDRPYGAGVPGLTRLFVGMLLGAWRLNSASAGHQVTAHSVGEAAKTLASIRKRSTEDVPQSNARVGRYGRVRSLNSGEGRRRAAELLAQQRRTPA